MLAEAPCDSSTIRKDQFQYELMASVEQVEDKKWTLYFDGFECLKGEGEGIILVSP